MSPELITMVAEHGVVGALLGLCLYALRKERDETKTANRRAQKAEQSRTDDAHKVARMLLDHQKEANQTLTTLASALASQQHAIRAIEQEVRTVGSLVRSK